MSFGGLGNYPTPTYTTPYGSYGKPSGAGATPGFGGPSSSPYGGGASSFGGHGPSGFGGLGASPYTSPSLGAPTPSSYGPPGASPYSAPPPSFGATPPPFGSTPFGAPQPGLGGYGLSRERALSAGAPPPPFQHTNAPPNYGSTAGGLFAASGASAGPQAPKRPGAAPAFPSQSFGPSGSTYGAAAGVGAGSNFPPPPSAGFGGAPPSASYAPPPPAGSNFNLPPAPAPAAGGFGASAKSGAPAGPPFTQPPFPNPAPSLKLTGQSGNHSPRSFQQPPSPHHSTTSAGSRALQQSLADLSSFKAHPTFQKQSAGFLSSTPRQLDSSSYTDPKKAGTYVGPTMMGATPGPGSYNPQTSSFLKNPTSASPKKGV